MSFAISDHQNSKRVRVIKLKESDLDRLVFPFKKHTTLSLEYKPFSRFSLAKSLDEVFENKLSKTLNEILNDRKTGTAIIEPEINNKKFDKDFLVKLSTGLAYLIGNPNFDSMSGKYYARFHVKHQDSSDSYLRKAYTNLDLHTDGTFVKEKTDWLIMSKLEEKNVKGGETAVLHLDDLENLNDLLKDLNKLFTFIEIFDFEGDFAFNKLYLWIEKNLKDECIEYIVSMMLEPYDEIVDPLISGMSSEEEKFFNIPLKL